MELFETIRREYQFGVGTIKGVSRKLGIHRRMVREARWPMPFPKNGGRANDQNPNSSRRFRSLTRFWKTI